MVVVEKINTLKSIEKNFKELKLKPIENYKVNGDFVESQAFAFLAIRSLKNMPISFPNTTRCKKPLTGGVLVEKFFSKGQFLF